MTVRAKFYISSLELLPGQNSGGIVHMQAVSRGDRNATWAAATPVGQLNMTVNNPAGFAFFENLMDTSRRTGKQPELFIDIAPSTDGWPGDGHAFRLADVPEGAYGHGACGECGVAKDAGMYDPETRKIDPDVLAHPNG